jgi:hypothetical protein
VKILCRILFYFYWKRSFCFAIDYVPIALCNHWILLLRGRRDGTDMAGLAEPLLSGKVDLLGDFAMLMLYDIDDNKTENIGDGDKKNTIDRISSTHLTYQDFVENYMRKNKPVIITNLIKDSIGNTSTDIWGVRSSDWVDENKSYPNIPQIKLLFGNEVVPVHEQEKAGFTTVRPKVKEAAVHQYCDWWMTYHGKDSKEGWKHHQGQALEQSVHTNSSDEMESREKEILYLKDWKFQQAFPEHALYPCPTYFQNDWLNECTNGSYKFIYLGPKGSCTRFHVDVLCSFSWSTNICGRKHWYMIPPQYTYLLFDCFGNLAAHLHQDTEEGEGGNNTFYPGLKLARLYAIEVVQESTETIFVPSGWYHTVENMQPTLSVNHNWINEANISWSWSKVSSEILSLHNSKSVRENETNSIQQHSCSQIEDDVNLIWKMVSTKAKDTLRIIRQRPHCDTESLRLILQAITPVLKCIENMARDGILSYFNLNIRHCDVVNLLHHIYDAGLQTKETVVL